MTDVDFLVLAWSQNGEMQAHLYGVDHLDIPTIAERGRELERLGYQSVIARRLLVEDLGACLRELDGLRMTDPLEGQGWEPGLGLLDALDALTAPKEVPAAEVERLARVLGLHRLSTFLGVEEDLVQKAIDNVPPVGAEIAPKVRYLSILVGTLATLYNDFGARRFLDEPRERLGGHTPADLLSRSWDPTGTAPTRILEVARAMRP